MAYDDSSDRLTEAHCEVTTSSGGRAEIHYSEWSSRSIAYDTYQAQNHDGSVTAWREFDRWNVTPIANDWSHKVALLYRGAPWSVTIYANSAADRDEVLRELDYRPVSDLMGERTP